MPSYSVVRGPNDTQYCAITKLPDDMPEEGDPSSGERVGSAYRDPVEFHMSKLVNPRGLKVADVVLNGVNMLIVSARMKAVLEKNAKGEIEYLPIRLMNHKGRAAEEACFIANVIGTHDCADRKRSKGVASPTDDEIVSCDRLVLQASKAPKTVNIFRTSLYPPHVVVRDDLRAAIEAARLTVRFLDIET